METLAIGYWLCSSNFSDIFQCFVECCLIIHLAVHQKLQIHHLNLDDVVRRSSEVRFKIELVNLHIGSTCMVVYLNERLYNLLSLQKFAMEKVILKLSNDELVIIHGSYVHLKDP